MYLRSYWYTAFQSFAVLLQVTESAASGETLQVMKHWAGALECIILPIRKCVSETTKGKLFRNSVLGGGGNRSQQHL